jgi:hypothetical protein
MQDQDTTKTKPKIILGFLKGFSLLLTYEIIEELLEELIAWSITAVLAKALSFLIVVLLTQLVKISAKALGKALTIALKPVVKKAIYRPGNDKINFILRRIKMADIIKTDPEQVEKKPNKIGELLKKLIDYCKRNIKSNIATVTNVLSSLASGSVVGGGLYLGGVAIPQWAYIIIGVIVTVAVFILTELGVKGAGFETPEQYAKRTEAEKAVKDIKKIQKQEKIAAAEAEKKVKAEAKKLQAILDAEKIEKAKAERIAAEKLARDKALENARKYQEAVAGGYKGSLTDWLSEKK